MTDTLPLAPGACADAIVFLESASPADDAGKWIDPWLLLRKVRSAWQLAAGASVAAGLAAAFAYLPLALRHQHQVFGIDIDRRVGRFIVAGAAATAFFLAYYGLAFLRLGSGVAIPEPYQILRIRNAMAPFDAIAREHLRRWRRPPHAS